MSNGPDSGEFRRWIISQIGWRELYACPLSFERRGLLRLFYTDAWCDRLRPLVRKLPRPYSGLATRYHSEFPREKVVSFTAGTVVRAFRQHLLKNRQTTESLFNAYNEIGEWFAKNVVRHLSHQLLDENRDIVFGFSTGSLEILQWAQKRGLYRVLDQLDPGRVDEDMIREESARWEGWQALKGAVPRSYYDRLAGEWAMADLIVVNSHFSRRALIQQGAAAQKIVVVPLAYEPEAPGAMPRTSQRDKALEVLWLGQVVLRKGIPYLFEAARLLLNENVRFHVAGPIGVSEMALQNAPKNMTIHGRVSRERALELYKTCDVFVLPTISDGFAITQLEAMSFGLPVITTPNCGDVVTTGVDGEIIPIRDPQALADAIMRLANDRELLAGMSVQAMEKSRQFTLDRYCDTIVRASSGTFPIDQTAQQPITDSRTATAVVPRGRSAVAVRHQWIIAQIGSRQHYAVARGFSTIGQFRRLYTDVWCSKWARNLLLRGNSSMRAFAGRWHPDVPTEKVVRFNLRAITDAIVNRDRGSWTVEKTYLDYLKVGTSFDESICAHLQHPGRINPVTDAFLGFNTGCLQTLRLLRDRGIPTVVDQIDPAKVEEDIVFAESAKWPGWQAMPGRVPQAYWDRLAAEWAAADLVLVNSQWSRTALVQLGVPAEKILVVPLAYEPAPGPIPMPVLKTEPLTILWLGSVILRKGIPYLMEAARLLKDTTLKFVIAGPIGISRQAVESAPPNMKFIGRITREQTNRIYQESDIFVLPTLSDGFAMTQLEAMNRGLPVVTTPNCGEVVTDGVEGFIIPPCDAPALAAALARLDQDRSLLMEMSQKAFIRSTRFLLPHQALEVEAAVCEMQARIGQGGQK